MLKKLYPADQIQSYLLIDVIAIVFLIYKVMITEGALGFLGQLIFVGLFLFSFYICLWHRDWLLLIASLVGCISLVILAVFVDEWILLYGFIFADLLGRAKRKVHIGIGILGIAAMHFVFSMIIEGNPFNIIKTVHFPFMIVQMLVPIVIFIKEKTNVLQEKLNTANEQLERYILEEERHRIARDLHDTLGQTLTMIKLKSELTMRLIDKDSNKAKQEVGDILITSRFALKQVRELVSDMKFVSLDEEIEQSQKFLKTAGIEMNNKRQEQVPVLTSVAETMLALSIREAITNIIKHSRAKLCIIKRFEQDGMYYIQVIDDGIGQISNGQGNGIHSMKERMKILQGEALVVANPENGITITLKIPILINGRREK